MKTLVSFDSFFEITNNSFYRTEVLGYRRMAAKDYTFLDIYLKHKHNIYFIDYAFNSTTTRTSISLCEQLYDISLNNVCYDVQRDKILKIDYFFFDKRQFLKLIESDEINKFYKTNFFNIKNECLSDLKLGGKKKYRCDSIVFAAKHFSDYNGYDYLEHKIKDNDEYTMCSLKKAKS